MSGFTSDSKCGAIESMDLNKTLDNLKVSEKLAPKEPQKINLELDESFKKHFLKKYLVPNYYEREHLAPYMNDSRWEYFKEFVEKWISDNQCWDAGPSNDLMDNFLYEFNQTDEADDAIFEAYKESGKVEPKKIKSDLDESSKKQFLNKYLVPFYYQKETLAPHWTDKKWDDFKEFVEYFESESGITNDLMDDCLEEFNIRGDNLFGEIGEDVFVGSEEDEKSTQESENDEKTAQLSEEKLTLKNVMNNVKVVFSRDDYNPENLLMYFKWNKDDVTNAMKIKDFETCDEETCDTYICDYKKKSLMWIEDVKKAANWKIGEKLYINSLERNEKGSAENRYMVVFSKEKYDCEGRFSVNHSFIVEEDGYAVMEMYNHYPESSNYSSYKSIYTDTFYQSRKMYLRVSSLYNDSICRNFRKERNESNDNFIEEEEEEEEDKQELSVETLKNISYSTNVEDNYMDITWDNNEEIDNIMEKEYRFHLNDSKKSMMWIEDVKKAANWKKYDRLYIFTKSQSDYNFRASWWYDKDDGTFNDNANIVIEEDGYVLMETRNNYTTRKDFEDKIPYFFFVRVDSFYNSFNRDNLMEEEKAATIELKEKYDGNKLMDIDNLNSNDYNKIMRIFSGEITDESFKYCEKNNRSIKSYFFSILEGQWYDCHEDINRGVLLTQAQKRDINNLIVSLSCKENSYFSSEEDDDEKYCVDVLTREHLSIANMSKVLKAFNVSCKGMTDSSVPLEVRRQSLYDTMFKEYNKANQTKKEEVNRLVKTFRRKKSIKKTGEYWDYCNKCYDADQAED